MVYSKKIFIYQNNTIVNPINIPLYESNNNLNMVVEIPKNNTYKYELDIENYLSHLSNGIKTFYEL